MIEPRTAHLDASTNAAIRRRERPEIPASWIVPPGLPGRGFRASARCPDLSLEKPGYSLAGLLLAIGDYGTRRGTLAGQEHAWWRSAVLVLPAIEVQLA